MCVLWWRGYSSLNFLPLRQVIQQEKTTRCHAERVAHHGQHSGPDAKKLTNMDDGRKLYHEDPVDQGEENLRQGMPVNVNNC